MHKNQNFMRALEALRSAADMLEICAEDRVAANIRQTIAELEEVK